MHNEYCGQNSLMTSNLTVNFGRSRLTWPPNRDNKESKCCGLFWVNVVVQTSEDKS